MSSKINIFASALCCLMMFAASAVAQDQCKQELIVLGIGQDAGAPQIGNPDDPAWRDPSKALWASSIALVDHENAKRYLFDATPNIKEQMNLLHKFAPHKSGHPYLDGVFLTHAHIGHYAGLMMLGHEAMGANKVPVFAMPRMMTYLQSNGPWDQLVRYENIVLKPLENEKSTKLSSDLHVKPIIVPHRDEYSETVGFYIKALNKTAFYLPDIDSWEKWRDVHGVDIEEIVLKSDYAFLDATFFDDNELPGRDMSKIPHPRISQTMALFSGYGEEDKSRIRFIHLNHTNKARFEESEQYRKVYDQGFAIAKRGERYCLD